MPVTTISNREFDRNTGCAKKAAKKGPVFITEGGTPAYVLLSVEEYRRLTGGTTKIADALAMPSGEEIVFDPPRAVIKTRATYSPSRK